jgi:hypothetical protein
MYVMIVLMFYQIHYSAAAVRRTGRKVAKGNISLEEAASRCRGTDA